MADGQLYIICDVFSPGAYGNPAWPDGAETYEHEEPFRYVVLVPVWEVASEANPAAVPLNEYFKTWTATDVATAGKVRWLRDESDDFRGRVLMPVPLPPETELHLTAEWDPPYDPAGPTSCEIRRKLGGYRLSNGSGFSSPHMEISAADWFEFSKANHSFPQATAFAHLSPRDQAEAIDWMCSAVVAWRNEKAAASRDQRPERLGPIETQAYDFHVSGTVLEETVDKPTGDPDRPYDDPDKPDSEDLLIRRWKAFLRSPMQPPGTGTRASDFYERMLRASETDAPVVGAAPEFAVPEDILGADPQIMMPAALRAGGNTVETCSFHRRLWEGLKEDAANLAERALIEKADKLSGYGERLRWPVPDDPEALRHFMTPKMRPGRAPEGWRGSNAYSLLGQLFRLGPVRSTDDLLAHVRVTSLSLEGIQATNVDAINTMLDSMEAGHPQMLDTPVSIDFRRDRIENTDANGSVTGSMINGIVHFAPKSADGHAIGLNAPDSTHPLYEVPATVLDLLSSDARQDMPRIDPITTRIGDPKTALFVRKPQRTGIHKSELYKPNLAIDAAHFAPFFRLKARIERFAFTGRDKQTTYRLSFTSFQHALEIDAVLKCLYDNWSECALWVTQRTDAGAQPEIRIVPLNAIAVLQRSPATRPSPRDRLAEGNYEIIVADDADETLKDALASAETPNTSGGAFETDLVIPSAHANDLVSIFADTRPQPVAAPPLFLMSHSFISRVSRSLDRIVERYVTTISPTPFDAGVSDLQEHLGNFNKLRVQLVDLTDQQGFRIKLTYPSALVNLPTPADHAQDQAENRHDWTAPQTLAAHGNPIDSRNGPHFTYWLSHLFSQQVKADPAESEDFRYQAYRDASRRFRFDGYAEHQYSYRVPFKPADDGTNIRFAISTDAHHPMELIQKGLPGVGNGSETHDLSPFISFDHRKSGNERIDLHLNLRALQILLALYRNDFPETQGQGESAVQLRQVYECLIDLIAALKQDATDSESALARLVVERWNFNNQGDPDPGPDNSDASYPSISRNLDWVGTGTLDLGRLIARQPANATNRRSLAVLESLVADTFRAFVVNLETLAAQLDDGTGSDEDKPWALFEIPFTGSDVDDLWDWGDGSGRPDDALYLVTNAVRVGLHIWRAASVVVREEFGDAFFLGLAPDEAAQRAYPELSGEDYNDPDLRRQARDQLDRYFERSDASPLHGKFRWLISRETDVGPAAPLPAPADLDPRREPLPRDQIRRSLFGDAEPYLNFPTGLFRGANRVSQLYLVPFAFRPIKGHPAIGDAVTTLAFAGFLLQLLDTIVSRKPLMQIQTTGSPGAQLSHARWLRAVEMVTKEDDGVADKLLRLIARVDDVDAMREWHDARQKRFFEGVTATVERALDARGGIKAELRSMLSRKPGLFATTKAFGVGVFDPDSFSQRLYSLRVHKQLRGFETGAAPDDVAPAPKNDADRFTFADIKHAQSGTNDAIPYLIDVLDDATYDNEFEIQQSVFRIDGTPQKINDREWNARHVDIDGMDRTIVTRGGTQARVAEDLIEDTNAFIVDPQDGGAAGGPARGKRPLEVDVVHYNPEWRIKVAEDAYRPLYILPARRPPLTPKQILPVAGQRFKDNDTPFRSNLIARWDDVPANGFGKQDFEETVTDVLDAKAEVDVPAATSANPGLVLKRRQEPGMMPFADHIRMDGWERIESYLSHYYFIVETDEEQSDGDVKYSSDSLEIDVEVRPTPFESTVSATTEAEIEKRSKLYAWFRYVRLTSQAKDTEEPQTVREPTPVTVDDVLKELNDWLIAPPASPDHFTRGLDLLREREVEHDRQLNRDASVNKAIRTRVLSSIDSDGVSRWRIGAVKTAPGVQDDSGIGHVAAVEFMQIYRQDEDDDQPKADLKKYVVRVSVLDEPWQYTRAKMRVKRNFRDVDGNNDPDINPVFVQTSPASPWSGYGRQVLTIGPKQFEAFNVPDAVAKLWVTRGAGVPNLEQWCYAGLDDDPRTFGPIVRRNILDSGVVRSGKEFTYWNRGEMGHPERAVTGYLEQRWRDAHYLQGNRNTIEPGSIDTRGWTYGRQLLTGTKGNDLGALFESISKSDTPGAQMDAVVSWHTPNEIEPGDEVLRVTWPVWFDPSNRQSD